jgi:hypothetical protein
LTEAVLLGKGPKKSGGVVEDEKIGPVRMGKDEPCMMRKRERPDWDGTFGGGRRKIEQAALLGCGSDLG